MLDLYCLQVVMGLPIKLTSVGNPWLRHFSHPQEKEGGPQKKPKKKKTPPSTPPPPPRSGSSYIFYNVCLSVCPHRQTDRQTDIVALIYRIKVIVLLLQVIHLPSNLFHLNHLQGQIVLLKLNLGQFSFDSNQFLFLFLQGLFHSSQF
jgi:hypothetical protein